MTPMYGACAYFLAVFACALTAFIGFFKVTNDLGSESEVKAFRRLVANYLFFCVSNAIGIWCNYGFLPAPLGMAMNTASIIAMAFCSYYWFTFVEARLGNDNIIAKRFHIVAKIFLLLDIAETLARPLTGWSFYYAADGTFVRGPLWAIHSLVPMFYFVAAFVRSAFALRAANSSATKREVRILLFFILCPIAATVIDLTVPDLPAYELIMLVGISTVFINLQERQINTDALTRLNNRRSADEWLFAKIKNVSARHPLYVFLSDVNDFKNINDTFGHIEGDNALRIVAEAFRKTGFLQRCFVARWGGDEFIMIVESEHLASATRIALTLQSFLKRMADEARLPYALTISIGIAVCTQKCNPGELVATADEMLYRDKKAHRNKNIPKEQPDVSSSVFIAK